MFLSCCAWSLNGSEKRVADDVAGAGYRSIDVRPFSFDSPQGGTLLASRLSVACVGLSAPFPDGIHLGNEDRQGAVHAMKLVAKGLRYARDMEATTAYVVPSGGNGRADLARLASAVVDVAEQARTCGLKLCIEHAPGSALPTVERTLQFIAEVDHDNLFLLMDVGHLQMCDEDVAASVEAAGERLGYVHVDDNDGVSDLHLSLLDGVMTADLLRRLFAALAQAAYDGAVSVELSAQLPDPAAAITRSRQFLLEAAPTLC